MSLTIEQYCEKYNYELIEEYTTIGEEHSHHRAIVKHKQTGEKYHLYFDKSYYKPYHNPKATLDLFGHLCDSLCYRRRGWRNTTLDNRRRKARNETNNN